jgi:hypothetical protein
VGIAAFGDFQGCAFHQTGISTAVFLEKPLKNGFEDLFNLL